MNNKKKLVIWLISVFLLWIGLVVTGNIIFNYSRYRAYYYIKHLNGFCLVSKNRQHQWYKTESLFRKIYCQSCLEEL